MHFQKNKITAVIPTRNRPYDLVTAVKSVYDQTRPPDELIIIDQSDNEDSKLNINLFVKDHENIKLIYIYDPKISGLVEAKNESLIYANGDLICFLEDDVVLETEYFSELEIGFDKKPEMLGCCGVVTNPPQNNFLHKLLFKLFHWGIYKDPRVFLNGLSFKIHNQFLKSDKLSGGISAWRREVFDAVSFDLLNGFHLFEDIDFSTRVAKYFGPRLFINRNVRLAHYCSPLNRDFLGSRQRRKLTECFIYYKKRKEWPWARISHFILLIGMLLDAGYESIRSKSIQSLKGYFLGLYDGFCKKIINEQP
jgi:GT2 family glycosyltransferase